MPVIAEDEETVVCVDWRGVKFASGRVVPIDEFIYIGVVAPPEKKRPLAGSVVT